MTAETTTDKTVVIDAHPRMRRRRAVFDLPLFVCTGIVALEFALLLRFGFGELTRFMRAYDLPTMPMWMWRSLDWLWAGGKGMYLVATVTLLVPLIVPSFRGYCPATVDNRWPRMLRRTSVLLLAMPMVLVSLAFYPAVERYWSAAHPGQTDQGGSHFRSMDALLGFDSIERQLPLGSRPLQEPVDKSEHILADGTKLTVLLTGPRGPSSHGPIYPLIVEEDGSVCLPVGQLFGSGYRIDTADGVSRLTIVWGGADRLSKTVYEWDGRTFRYITDHRHTPTP